MKLENQLANKCVYEATTIRVIGTIFLYLLAIKTPKAIAILIYLRKYDIVPNTCANTSYRQVLADWAKRTLNMTEEEMLAQGGMVVQLDELMPFRKALIHAENEAKEILEKYEVKSKIANVSISLSC